MGKKLTQIMSTLLALRHICSSGILCDKDLIGIHKRAHLCSVVPLFNGCFVILTEANSSSGHLPALAYGLVADISC